MTAVISQSWQLHGRGQSMRDGPAASPLTAQLNSPGPLPCHAGGIGALVRLLRPDVEPTAQTAAAAALSLLAARDIVIQDSVRYLGGIDHLVGGCGWEEGEESRQTVTASASACTLKHLLAAAAAPPPPPPATVHSIKSIPYSHCIARGLTALIAVCVATPACLPLG
jgi:hypothetical protein